jgi:ABC-type nitrate/sulfonate/bicarbonate transport system permease component
MKAVQGAPVASAGIGEHHARVRGTAIVAAVRRALPPLALTLCLLAVWELYVRAASVPPTILPAPTRVISASVENADLLSWHARRTLAETVAGFVVAVAVAALCAVAIDFFPPVRRALFPLLITSQTVPIIALAPLLVLWFGYGMLPKVLVVALVCFFPRVVAAVHGLAATDPELIKLYRTFAASRAQIFRLVRLPTALPAFFAGVRIAVTYSVIGAVFGEYVGATRGLGILLQTAKNSYRTDLVFAMIGATAALSLALYAIVALIERLAIPWSRVAAAEGQWRGAAEREPSEEP